MGSLLNLDTFEKFESIKKELAEIKRSLEPAARQEVVISSGVTFMGTGAQLRSSFPIQSIPKSDIIETLDDQKKSIASFVKQITKMDRKSNLQNDKSKEND